MTAAVLRPTLGAGTVKPKKDRRIVSCPVSGQFGVFARRREFARPIDSVCGWRCGVAFPAPRGEVSETRPSCVAGALREPEPLHSGNERRSGQSQYTMGVD